MEKLKSKLLSTLGVFGFVLYLIVGIIVCGAPLLVIPMPRFLSVALLVLLLCFPTIGSLLDLVLWPVGLYFTINGRQDTIAVIYYVLFAVNVVRLIFAVVSALVSRRAA